MFDSVFDSSMLENVNAYGSGLIVHCPTIEVFSMFLEIASGRGIRWNNGDPVVCENVGSIYDKFKSETCCLILPQAGIRIMQKESASDSPYKNCTKCSMSELSNQTFEAEDDEALKSLLGI